MEDLEMLILDLCIIIAAGRRGPDLCIIGAEGSGFKQN